MRATIIFHTDQKFEKFQMIPEVPEFVSDVVAGLSVAGLIADVIVVADALTPTCGGAST